MPIDYFFFNDTATTEIYTLSLHDALPIWDAAHVVVHRGLHRDRLAGDVDAGEDARRLRDARQPLVNDAGPEVLEVQRNMIVLGTDTASLTDLERHRPAHDVARGEILGVRRI